jgi:hypothetical protein
MHGTRGTWGYMDPSSGMPGGGGNLRTSGVSNAIALAAWSNYCSILQGFEDSRISDHWVSSIEPSQYLVGWLPVQWYSGYSGYLAIMWFLPSVRNSVNLVYIPPGIPELRPIYPQVPRESGIPWAAANIFPSTQSTQSTQSTWNPLAAAHISPSTQSTEYLASLSCGPYIPKYLPDIPIGKYWHSKYEFVLGLGGARWG